MSVNYYLDEAQELLVYEQRALLNLLKIKEVEDVSKAQSSLKNFLVEVSTTGDIDTLFQVEKALLTNELEYYSDTPAMISSLAAAVKEVDAAIVMLGAVRDPSTYQHFNSTLYTLPKTRKGELPLDPARMFFASHLSRLQNLDKSRTSNNEKSVIAARIKTVRAAQKIYIGLQRQALVKTQEREKDDDLGMEL